MDLGQRVVDRLVDRGFEVLALSVRGHGDSSGSARFASLGKYLADLSSVLDKLDRSPVIVGHSTGGLITQRLIAKRPVVGAVLMASVSPRGMGASEPGRRVDIKVDSVRDRPYSLANAIIQSG